MDSNYEVVAVVSDNTETYFHRAGIYGANIHRRTAIVLVKSKEYGLCSVSLFVDEKGDVDTNLNVEYDVFTKGLVNNLLNNPTFRKAKNPEDVFPFLKTLLTSYGFVFAKPESNPLVVDVIFDQNDTFQLSNTASDVLGFNDMAAVALNEEYKADEIEDIKRIGKWLGFFRVAFQMRDLKYELDFQYAKGYGRKTWEDEREEYGCLAYEEQCRIDTENESKYKENWEKIINDTAQEYYDFFSKKLCE